MTESEALHAPATPKRPVVDEYHGVAVTDDYRWLEHAGDPEVRAWTDAQNRYTRAVLDRAESRQRLDARLRQIYAEASADYFDLKMVAGQLFAIKLQPPKDQPLLVALGSPDDVASERVVLDPNALDPGGATAIDFYQPSPDGRLVAVSLSQNGSEDGTLFVYDVATGRALGDSIPRVTYPTGGGSVAWNANSTGLFYTRYPRAGERPDEDLPFYQQIYFHALGTPTDADTYEIGADFPRIAVPMLERSADGRYLLAEVGNGDGGEYAHYLRGPSGAWVQVTRFADGASGGHLGADGSLYLISHRDAPNGRVLSLPLDAPDLASARVLVPEGDAAVQSVTPMATKLYVVQIAGGPSQIRVYGLDGASHGELPLAPISAVSELAGLAGDTILYRSNTFVEPAAWYRFDPAEEEPARTSLRGSSPADFRGVEVVRAFATSRDGTRVPISILRREGIALDGSHPALLYGYGGFGISLAPFFDASISLWLERGGVFAVANLRGGGEYGEAWHLAGNLTKKQSVFDDFAGCAEYLIAAGYTSAERLAIMGRSNGGLLVGAALTQRPELFRAAVPHVGIYDMLRLELDANGAFNVTEFGTVTDPEQFRALYAYSPYHRVADGTAYPAVLLLTGEHDGRANPAHSRKLAARLQAATSSGRPVLLRTSASSGHGIGTGLNERIAEKTDVYAFLFEQLGMNGKDER